MATATPPLAVPSSLVSTTPVTPADGGELARLRHAVLPDRGVEHQQHLVRRAGHLAGGDAADLVELAHQVDARVQPAGGVDEHGVGAARLGRGQRVEDDRGRRPTPSCARTMSTPARVAQICS